jgi:hypothetical protein
MCNTSTFGGSLDLYCMGSADDQPSVGDPPMSYTLPGPGLLLFIRAWCGPLVYWWWAPTPPPDPVGVWWCGGPQYGVPYWCAFDEIECLQPVTLNQLAYTPSTIPIGDVPGDGGFVPPGAQAQTPICGGFPASVTIVPA